MPETEMSEADRKEVRDAFHQAVNMTPAELRRWLATDDSRSVGMTGAGDKVTAPGGGESVGHHMGEQILALRDKPQAQYDADDYAAMRKVTGYVHRHAAQRPAGDIADTRWRKSLMNWGHDPAK